MLFQEQQIQKIITENELLSKKNILLEKELFISNTKYAEIKENYKQEFEELIKRLSDSHESYINTNKEQKEQLSVKHSQDYLDIIEENKKLIWDIEQEREKTQGERNEKEEIQKKMSVLIVKLSEISDKFQSLENLNYKLNEKILFEQERFKDLEDKSKKYKDVLEDQQNQFDEWKIRNKQIYEPHDQSQQNELLKNDLKVIFLIIDYRIEI